MCFITIIYTIALGFVNSVYGEEISEGLGERKVHPSPYYPRKESNPFAAVRMPSRKQSLSFHLGFKSSFK